MKSKHLFYVQAVTLIMVWVASLNFSAEASEVILQDSKFLVAFDDRTGAITRMEDKILGWKIMDQSQFGVSFRMLVPTAEHRMNYILGQKQRVSSIEKISDNTVVMVWKNLTSEFGGQLPITFTSTVTLVNGKLTFDPVLENNSSLSIETVDYPYWGALNPPSQNGSLNVRTMWYGNLRSEEIYPSFTNQKGYWGVFSPMKTFDSNQSLYCLLQSSNQGLYVGMHDATQRYLLQYTFEQYPGVVSGMTDRIPKEHQIGGKDVHMEFRACHFVFAHPDTKVDLAPVVVQGYKGNWHAGVDLYKEWRTTWFKPARRPAWIDDVHSWLQLQINSPEGSRVPFKDLIKYAGECTRYGVGAIQLVGWNRDGQDGGDPNHTPDPELGTKEEFRDIIAKIQKEGVKMVLFGKINWADLTSDWYKKELYKYECKDPNGIMYTHGGYSYLTPTQLAGINTRKRAVMDFCSPGYQDAIAKEFENVLYLGASGWLFDENCHHGPVKYNFAPDHGYKAPGYIYSGDLPLANRLREEAMKVNPDFLFAGEGHQDWLMQAYPCSYFRINNGSTAVDRYIDPYAPLVVAVTGFDDRETLNLILLNRYIISYEPYNFKGYLSDFPLTVAYGKKIDDLRRKYKSYLWDAEYRDTLGAEVSSNGNYRYSVFNTSSGKRAVVVINTESGKSIEVEVKLPNQGKLVSASPERPESVSFNGKIEIPARSAIVVMEQ